MTEGTDPDQGEGTALAVVSAAHAVRNMMDMPDALLTVMLEHMFRSDLTHSDRAALACVNRRLRRLCNPLGQFRMLRAFGEELFNSLSQIGSGATVDGLKIQGDSTDTECFGPIDTAADEQLLCMALGYMVGSPTASSVRALHIDTGAGRLCGESLGGLRQLSSLQALKIHSLYPPTYLNDALERLTGLTSLDFRVQLPDVPQWCAAAAAGCISEADAMCYTFPAALAACTRLRRLSLRFDAPGIMFFDELPAEFGNLAALESLTLVGCEVTALPTTITRLNRLTSLTIANGYFDNDHMQLRLPDGFCDAMQSLKKVCITWTRGNPLVL